MRSKIAFVTGAGGFIGGAVACKLAEEGVKVAVSDIREDALAATVEKIQSAGGEAQAYPANVSDPKDIDRAIRAAFADFGGLDIMIHAAGGSARERNRLFVEQTDEVIMDILNVNLLGALWSSRTAAQLMIEQGTGGRIINFSSIVASNGLKKLTEYAAAKGGVNGFTRSLAKELGPYHITVNAVAPGVVTHPRNGNNDEYARASNLFGDRCLPEDVADLTVFLASEKARFITGQICVIDGGRSLSMKGSD